MKEDVNLKKKYVLSIDNSFTFGGAIISLSHLAKSIDKNKFPLVIVSGQSEDYLEKSFPDCIRYHYKPKLAWINNNIYLKISNFFLFKNLFAKKALSILRLFYWLFFINIPQGFKYYKIGRRHNVKLVHLNNGIFIEGILAAKLLRVPCVSHTRSICPPLKFADRLVAKLVDHYIAISESVRKSILQTGISNNCITLIHNAIDTDEFNIDIDISYLSEEFNIKPGQPRYGIFGRVIPWKGTKEFILAAKEINLAFPESKAFIVGDISDGDMVFFRELQSLIGKSKLKNSVIFTGYRKDIPALMAFMDIIVLASNVPEPFGRVVIEGMATGKPVVATKGGGPLDIVEDGNTGYLVSMGNSVELGEAIIKLLNNVELCKEFGSRGRKRVELMFDNKKYAEKIEKIFVRLTNIDGEKVE